MDSLRGHLLVASPALDDPNFDRTVILIAEHNDDGALGLVLNRETPIVVTEAAPELAVVATDEDRVRVGGPVQPEAVVMLAEFDDTSIAASIVVADIGLVAGADDLEGLAAATRRVLVFAGYSGWGPGQLEAELERDDWVIERAIPEDIFDTPPGALWASVLERKGGRFRLLARMPEDPSLN